MQRNEDLKPETANSTPLGNSQGRVGWNTEDALKNASYFVFSAGSSRMICLTETPHLSSLSNQMRAMYQPSIRVLGCDRIQIFCCTNPVSRWCGIRRERSRRRRGRSWERRTKSWRKQLNFWCRRRCNEETRSTIEPKEMFIKRNVTGYFHISIWYLAMGGKYCFMIFFFLEYFYSLLLLLLSRGRSLKNRRQDVSCILGPGLLKLKFGLCFTPDAWLRLWSFFLVKILKFTRNSDVWLRFWSWCLV